jgi:NADH:ubiquinone oxidoreductase subunit 5 (subunit L)/multisubunit Na+/H+ antiporter MnhA subunit
MKAFITNKIADVGLMIGIIILALNTGTLRISEILYQATHDYDGITNVAFTAGIYCSLGQWAKVRNFLCMSGCQMQWQDQHLCLL